MSKIRVVLEAAKSVHPMAVHAYPSEKGKFKVHATGSKVTHVKKGDTVSSSDLDDLSDAGHKVKEVKKPLSEGKMGSGGHRTKDGTYVPYKSFEQSGQEVRAKRAEAGRALADADKKTRANAKEEVEPISELSPPVLARYVSKSHRDAMGHKAAHRDYAMLGREASMSRDDKSADELKAKGEKYKKLADKRTKGIENATKRLAKEEAEDVNEKLTPEAKSAVKTALGPKTPGNEMRKTSKTARTLISLLKTNKKNVAEADSGSVKQKAIQKYLEQGMSYNDAVKRAEIYLKKKGLM